MIKGSKHSEESKRKLSESRIGKPSWNKGKSWSPESKEKMRQAKLGKKMSLEFRNKRSEIMKAMWSDPEFKKDMSAKKAGVNNPNYGKHMSEEQRKRCSESAKKRTDGHIEKLRLMNIGKPISDDTKKKMSEAHAGDKCYNWKGGITKLNVHIRSLPRYKNICSDLMKEADYTDAFTGIRGGILACHHIIPQNTIIRMYNIKTIDDARNCDLLFDKHNLIVMLASAHDKFHNIYGDDKNIYELTDPQIKELYT